MTKPFDRVMASLREIKEWVGGKGTLRVNYPDGRRQDQTVDEFVQDGHRVEWDLSKGEKVDAVVPTKRQAKK
jgi:hypothetical protein